MKFNNTRAFTLVEMLIAVTILVIGLVGVLLVIPFAQRTAGLSAMATKAAIVGAEKMEELKSKGLASLLLQNEWTGSEDVFNWTAIISDVGPADFKELVSLPADNFVKIEMVVTYLDRGKEQSEVFTTLYSEL